MLTNGPSSEASLARVDTSMPEPLPRVAWPYAARRRLRPPVAVSRVVRVVRLRIAVGRPLADVVAALDVTVVACTRARPRDRRDAHGHRPLRPHDEGVLPARDLDLDGEPLVRRCARRDVVAATVVVRQAL